MARHRSGSGIRSWRSALVLATGLAALAAGAPGFALTRTDPYQATVPIADRSEAAQTEAFQTAMRTVLTRVTGRRDAPEDPALAALVGNARRYVQQYRGAANGGLLVSFDGAAIERWLEQSGQPVWGGERPVTLVWLTIPGGPRGGSVVSAEDGSDLKGALDAEAGERGIPLRWPTLAELQRDRLDFAAVNGAAPATLADLGRRLGGDGILIGRADGAAAGAAVRWTFLYEDRTAEFAGTLEGVDRAADAYAAVFAASGNAAPVEIEVEGIADLRDYAQVERYLGSLTVVSQVAVLELQGDSARFRLGARGGAAALERALASSARLQSTGAGGDGLPRYRLRH